MNRLYTYGYQRGSYEDLERFIAEGAMIVDIRLLPWSRNPLWGRVRLTEAFGRDYIHVREFGNRNYKGDLGEGTMLLDPAAGLARLEPILAKRPVVLICVCADPAGCHRTSVAALAQERWPGLAVRALLPGDRIEVGT